MKRKVLLTAAALALSLSGGQYVGNPDFEIGEENGIVPGWKGIGGPFSIRQGDGFNGTSGLVYENDDPNRAGVVSQNVALRPGRRYLVKGRIRTEGIRGEDVGAGIGVELSPGGAYSPCFKGTTADWMPVAFTSDIPAWASADRIRVTAFVRKGCTGKAWFDEITISDLDRPLCEVLSSSAYRNRAARGTVAFIATLNLPTTEGWRASFEIRAGGDCRTLEAEKLTTTCAAARTPVSELSLGESTVVFTLRGPDGNEAARKTMTFMRFEGPDTRNVHFDARGRTIVDGRLFFPLGIYVDPRDKTCLDEVAKSPFNCVLPGEVIEPISMFDECGRRGLKIVASLGEFYWGIGRKSRFASAEAAEKALVERVNAGKDHPALLAWYTADEFPSHLAGALEERRALLERLDPNHPTYAVTCHAGDVRRMFGGYEVVGSDPYPIGKNPDRDILQAAGWAAAVRKGTFGVRPIWQVPQIFDWIAHWPDCKTARAPTCEEMRSMVWQAIAEGANGLMCYSYNSLKWAAGRGHEPFAKSWADVCRVAAEVKAHEAELLSDEPSPQIGPRPDGLSARGWTKGGVRTVLLVNKFRERLQGELEIDGEKLTFDLAPIGVEFRSVGRKGVR